MTLDALGWTVLTPSADTHRVYLSTAGNDANDGLSEQSPKATIAAAKAQLRPGFPDWLLIRRGDTFNGPFGEWQLSGRSSSEPVVVTTYGVGSTRPTFRCGASDGLTVYQGALHDVVLSGFRLVADGYNGGNGSPVGISLLQPCVNVLVEDCAVEGFFTGARYQGFGGRHANVALRRSIIVDSYTTGAGHSQGIFAENCDGLLLEENVFDHNGWNEAIAGAVADIFRHNIYVQGNNTSTVVRGNIIARAGSHGLQARAGGEVSNNLFLGNSINLLVGDDIANAGAVVCSVLGNVVLDTKDIAPGLPRGWGIQFQCIASGEAAFNVVANRTAGGDPVGYQLDSTRGVGINNLDFHGNVSYRWGSVLSLVGTRFAGVKVRDCALEGTPPPAMAGITFANNRLSSTVDFANPNQNIGGYDATANDIGTLSAFLARARAQSKATWDPRFVGTAVAAHFRANFSLAVPVPVPPAPVEPLLTPDEVAALITTGRVIRRVFGS